MHSRSLLSRHRLGLPKHSAIANHCARWTIPANIATPYAMSFAVDQTFGVDPTSKTVGLEDGGGRGTAASAESLFLRTRPKRADLHHLAVVKSVHRVEMAWPSPSLPHSGMVWSDNSTPPPAPQPIQRVQDKLREATSLEHLAAHPPLSKRRHRPDVKTTTSCIYFVGTPQCKEPLAVDLTRQHDAFSATWHISHPIADPSAVPPLAKTRKSTSSPHQ